jgi:hypothetical protein
VRPRQVEEFHDLGIELRGDGEKCGFGFGFDIYSNINQLGVLKACGTFNLELRLPWIGDCSRLYWVNYG